MSLLKMAMAKKLFGEKSYNDLKDKPFCEFDSPENEVDIRFHANDYHDDLNPDVQTYFVSDRVFTKEELLSTGSPFHMEVRNISDNTVLTTVELSKTKCYEASDGSFLSFRVDLQELGGFYRDNAYVHIVYNCEKAYFFDAHNPAPKNGVYFSHSSYYDNRVERLYRDGKGVKTLDNKYLDLENHPVIKDILAKLG